MKRIEPEQQSSIKGLLARVNFVYSLNSKERLNLTYKLRPSSIELAVNFMLTLLLTSTP